MRAETVPEPPETGMKMFARDATRQIGAMEHDRLAGCINRDNKHSESREACG